MLKALLMWLPRNTCAILGVLQAIVKAIKEILTLAADALFIPQAKIEKIRKIINTVDAVLEKIKGFLLKVGA